MDLPNIDGWGSLPDVTGLAGPLLQGEMPDGLRRLESVDDITEGATLLHRQGDEFQCLKVFAVNCRLRYYLRGPKRATITSGVVYEGMMRDGRAVRGAPLEFGYRDVSVIIREEHLGHEEFYLVQQ